MATFTWNTSSGAFNTGTNWTPSGPPSTADNAVFGSGTGTISGAGNVATLQLNTGGPWTWTGTVTARNYNVNDAVTLSSGAAWTLSGTPVSSNYMVVGSGSGNTGNLTVASGASITSTQTANTKAYALYVSSGTFSNAVGVLTVSGAGSSVNTGQNGAAVGYAGTGTMTVQSSGSATFTSTDSTQIAALAIGHTSGSSGTVNVTGAGSSVTANGFVYVGRGGTGALTVSAGATFNGGAAASGSVASASISIGDSTAASASSQQFGGTGTAQVTTAATLHSLGNLNIGANGTTGSLTVDGTSSVARADGTIAVGTGTDRVGGKGTLTVQNGGTARAGTAATGSAGIAIGSGMSGQTGTATVTGVGSLLDANGFRISLGTATTSAGATTGGAGTLTISNGAHALAGANYSNTEAALAVGAVAGGTGTISITGTGSELIASGAAIIGGTNSGSGITQGGTGTVSVTAGGILQTGAITIEAGSSLTVDQSSTLAAPTVNINGGAADLGNLTSTTAVSFGAGGTLRLHTLTGSNTIANFTFGDTIDFANTTAVTLSGNTVAGGGGTLTLAAAPANSSYQLISDGNGGQFVALEPKTIGVYRFFDQSTGTHFYTADSTENQTVLQTRPDLKPEGPGGIGLQALASSSSDPNAAPVYRFFDTVFGTHFFTASASERDGLIATRSDLTYEPNSTFYEHTIQQPGDVAVYRFFDSVHGTHFYTDSPSERAGILANRSDLVSEGIGFYEPPQNS